MDIFDKLVSGASQLPVSLQSESAECGLSCLAMISSYHGAHVTTSSLRAKYGISSAGANLKQLIGIAEGLRLSSRPLRVELSDLELLRTPCILHWQFKHFVVLKSAKGGKFVIHDPAFGVRHLSKEVVSSEFTGIAIELWPELEFEKKQKIPRVSIARVVGRLVGLTRSISRVIAVSLLIEILSLLSPLYMQWVIDYVIVNDDRDLMTTLALSFGLLVIFQQIFRWSREWMMLHLSSNFGLQWRSNVFSHLVNLSPDYFQKRHLGDVVSRFNGVDSIQRTLTSSFLVSIIDSVMALAVLAMMVVYSPMLAVISLASTLLYVIVKCAWYVPMNAANLEQVVRTAQQQSNFLETVRGIKTIRLYHKQSDRHASWLSLYARQLNSSVKLQKLSIGYQQISSLLSGAENIIVLWCGAQMIMDGYFSVGALVAFNSYRLQFGARAVNLADKYFDIRMLGVQVERLSDIVLTPKENQELNAFGKNPPVMETLELKGLAYRYSEYTPWTLKNINLKLNAGDSLAITGVSGSGKSTLINILLGLVQVGQGQILLNGVEVSDSKVLRNLSASVLQEDQLFAGTLLENISFFDEDLNEEKAMRAARLAAIHEEILEMPMGYHTLVGDMGSSLSGGQKQRIMLARAFYREPQILFLDEATSHLDIPNEIKVNEAIKQLKITRIVVAHRPQTIASADRIVVIENGLISHSYLRDGTGKMINAMDQ